MGLQDNNVVKGPSRSGSIPLKQARGLAETQPMSMIREKDAHIAALQKEIALLTNKLSSSAHRGHYHASNNDIQKRSHKMTPYGTVVFDSNNNASGRLLLSHERSRMGRNASISTVNELKSLSSDTEEALHASNHALVSHILEMFKDPQSHVQYLKSNEFARDILRVTAKVRPIFEHEPRVTFLQSPVYVFGDIHGNLEDLHFFSDNIWRLGMSLTGM